RPAHRVDPLRADAQLVAEVPFQLVGLSAAATLPGGSSGAALSAGHGNHGVIPLTVDAARATGFFKRTQGHEALDEDFEELHETSVFLYGNDQPVVFLA